MKILVWGIGQECKEYIEEGNENFICDEFLSGGIDVNKEKQAETLRGKPIYSPEEIASGKIDYDYILIGSMYFSDNIYDCAKKYKLERRMLPYNAWRSLTYEWFNNSIRYCFNDDNFEIIQGWLSYEENGIESQRIVIRVRGLSGDVIKLKVLPYGCFGKNFRTANLRVRGITSPFFQEIKTKRETIVEIPIRFNKEIIELEIDGRHRAVFFHDIVFELSDKFERLSDTSITCLKGLISGSNKNGIHDEDYGFLKKFKEIQDGEILDIGANVGQSSISFLKLTNMGITAFEPNPNLKEILGAVSELYDPEGRLDIYQCGVGEKNDKLTFYSLNDVRYTQLSSFDKNHVCGRTEAHDSNILSTEIDVVSIDSISFKRPVVFTKIDVEGLELKVLKGMEKTIRNYRPILLLEYNGKGERDKIIDYVSSIENYSLYYWDYFDMKFYKEDRRGTFNYFLLPACHGNENCEKILRKLIAE